MLHRSSSTGNNPSDPTYIVHAIGMKDVDPQWLSDQIMIIDLGIAFLQDISSADIGTPKSYCAPEFLFHSPRSVSSDIWALGCTIFEIRTGTRLFRYKGRPTRSQMLKAMVNILGTLPEKWWANWDEGRDWYATQTKMGGDLADIVQGTLYNQIMDVGIHDEDYPPSASSHKGEALGYDPGDDSAKGTTSGMVARVGELTTSEAEEALAEVNEIDFGSGESGCTKSGSASRNSNSGNKTEPRSSSGSANKTTSGSSNAKSGEKSISSEGISLEGISTRLGKDDSLLNTTEMDEDSNLVGDESLARAPLEPVKELPETGEVMELLEPAGTRITIVEASGLENLLRRALMFLPEQRLRPLELTKHHWFVDDFQD